MNEYTEDRIQLALAPRDVRYYPTIGSTNNAASEWLQQGAAHGSIVIADEQTEGRGRHGRTWHTPPGVAIACSVILKPQSDHIHGVNMASTLAVHRTLQTLQLQNLSIKWANDVLVDGKKISGVLPEVIWDGDNRIGVVLGIGVNVRNNFTGTVLHGQATTAEAEAGRPLDRVSLLAVLLYQLDSWLERLGTEMLLSSYRAEMRSMIGQNITVTDGKNDVRGVALDVEMDGALVVRTEEGNLKRVYAGDVSVKKFGD